MDDRENEERLKAWVSQVTRRRFLLGLGFVAGASLAPPFLTRAGAMVTIGNVSGYPVNNPPPGHPIAPVSFCLLGDFGAGKIIDGEGHTVPTINPNAQAVAEGISLYAPKESTGYVVSLGDQIYIPYFGPSILPPVGNFEQWEADNITPFDQAIGALYSQYIQFPAGSSSVFANSGSPAQRFYAILGDHDWWHQPRTTITAPAWEMDTTSYPPYPDATTQLLFSLDGSDCFYNDYFANQGEGSSSGNCRYWDVVNNDIHWIALSSDITEVLTGTLSNAFYGETELLPGNLTAGEDNLTNSTQGQWFQQVTGTDNTKWRMVITHYPPYTSSSPAVHGHDPAYYMQWGYENFGVDMVFSGHMHAYERLYVNGVTYVVCGGGGTFESLSGFATPVGQNGSIIQVPLQYGFITAEQTDGYIFFSYFSFIGRADKTKINSEKRVLSDRFVMLKGGTLSGSDTFVNLKSIHVTSGGGAITFTGSHSHNGDLLGIGTLVKNGTGVLDLNSVSPNFTGTLQINDGSIRLIKTNTLPDASLVLGMKGTLNILSSSQALSTPLVVQGNGQIALNNKSVISFADSSRTPWTGTLLIQGTMGKQGIRFGTSSTALTVGQLASITRKSGGGRAQLDAQGYLVFA